MRNTVRVPHQAVVEFVAATTRNLDRRRPLLSPAARREAEELLSQFVILYPTVRLVRTAIRGCATDGLGWFDAHPWAYAEDYSLAELVSEDFEHGRNYGTVRTVTPFLAGR